MIRLGLIQAQKTRVDASAALEALDQLLKANELNFAVIAAMPSILIIFGTCRWIYSIIWKSKEDKNNITKKGIDGMKKSLRELQSSLGKVELENKGKMVIAILSFQKNASIVLKDLNGMKWIEEDLIFILDDTIDLSARLLSADRLWRYF